MSARVVAEQRLVYRVPGGCSRFTKAAAYREAARVAIRKACHCYYEPEVNYGETCRFHGERLDGYAFGHPDATSHRAERCFDEPGEAHGHRSRKIALDGGGYDLGDGGRGYYMLVRERLMRWLMWRDAR